MIEKVQLNGGICEPSSDIPPNWRDMRSEFGYKLLGEIFRLLWPNRQSKSENHPILPPSFNQEQREKNNLCQIASQPCITTIKRLATLDTNFFLTNGGFTINGLNKEIKVPVFVYVEILLRRWRERIIKADVNMGREG